VAQDKFELAEKLLLGVREEQPRRVESWVALAGLRQRQSRSAIDLSLRDREYAQALTLAQEAVAANPRDYRHRLWLANVRRVTDPQSAEVEPGLHRAVALAPDRPEPWVALVQYLVRSDKKESAEKEVGQAESKLSRRQHTLALARCYELVGQLDGARELYREQLTADPHNPQLLRGAANFSLRHGDPEQAKRHLHHILALKEKAGEEANTGAARLPPLTG
jgi:tetratricopeptide (TPR) repeat protein